MLRLIAVLAVVVAGVRAAPGGYYSHAASVPVAFAAPAAVVAKPVAPYGYGHHSAYGYGHHHQAIAPVAFAAPLSPVAAHVAYSPGAYSHHSSVHVARAVPAVPAVSVYPHDAALAHAYGSPVAYASPHGYF